MNERQGRVDSQTDKRLIGRFLYLADSHHQCYDSYDFARHFATEYSDVINMKRDSSMVSVEKIDDKIVELEFSKLPDDTFTWRIIVTGETYNSNHISSGVIPRGGEQYELICSDKSIQAHYYEMNVQRAIVRKEILDHQDDMDILQGVIEYMTDTHDFHKNVSRIRGDSSRANSEIVRLMQKKPLNYSDEKNLRSLKSHLFQAGFPVGSPTISNKIPLFGECNDQQMAE